MGQLLQDVTCQEAKVLGGEEVCTGPDEATVCQGRQGSPFSIGQAGSCMHHITIPILML